MSLNAACGASANPLGAGVPAAVSCGGATGLPDLPRDARGLGAVALARGSGAGRFVPACFLEGGFARDFGVFTIEAKYGPRNARRQGGAAYIPG